jgi:hypothetical protein
MRLGKESFLRRDGGSRRRRWLWIGLSLAAGAALVGTGVIVAGLAGRPPHRDLQAPLFRGVSYHRAFLASPRPLMIHVIRVDLTAPGVRCLVTPGDSSAGQEIRAATTLDFARRHHVQVAVNGDRWTPFRARNYTLNDYYPHSGDPVAVQGLAISDGRLYSAARPGTFALCVGATNALIVASDAPAGTRQAVAGAPLLIADGTNALPPGADQTPQPRTAVALDRAGTTLWLIVVDGRQSGYSEGMTMPELARLARDLGAWSALNLDGGGSATLVAESRGKLRVLNSPIHTGLPRRQRPVANHLGIYARP